MQIGSEFLKDLKFCASGAWRGFIWVALATTFGLSQLFVILFLATISSKIPSTDVVLERQLSDGAVLFFALALTSSLSLDHWFDTLDVELRGLEGPLLFIVWPLLIWVISMLFFAVLVLDPSSISGTLGVKFQQCIMATCLFHAWLVKSSELARLEE